MAWPCRRAAHRGFLQKAREAWAAAARAIAQFEPVVMAARPEDAKEARQKLGRGIEVWPVEIDDAWFRDSGPTFLVNNRGGRAGVDWMFNAWGRKYRPLEGDDAVAARILRRLRMPRYLAPLVMEGGSVHANGAGVILATEQCQLNPNRNPRLNRADIEFLLCEYLGARKIVWLWGDPADDETDGHIDNIACFAGENTALLCDVRSRRAARENEKRLRAATDVRGRRFEIIKLPLPALPARLRHLPASYINFYIANGGIVAPSFGVREDDEARAILAECFPGRRVEQVPALDIVRGGGGIHCITQQQPRASAQVIE